MKEGTEEKSRTYLSQQLENFNTVCVCVCVMFVFQAFKHPQQMCLNETGCQPPQKESKTFYWIWYLSQCVRISILGPN